MFCFYLIFRKILTQSGDKFISIKIFIPCLDQFLSLRLAMLHRLMLHRYQLLLDKDKLLKSLV
ncbi:unknown [Crocosphaera subtropica ATCC 51142]|uniref:Uncharacterized protein n=1 Tax=Crocosphaera subtropica (strain ATCC 51142 / BH68) TaxID=43989 RepID=B1WXM2_CROS5|nr:unknown [Crocosphaera subtropica ATCC 51142]